METIWIIGAGKFGIHAFQGLSKQASSRNMGPEAALNFVIVDPDPNVCPSSFFLPEGSGIQVDIVTMNGVDFLLKNLGRLSSHPHWSPPHPPSMPNKGQGRRNPPSSHEDVWPDWIIPALPIHLAAEWCHAMLNVDIGKTGQHADMPPSPITKIDIPTPLDTLVPHPMRGTNGDLYVSHADFLCPANCSEPDDICTVTRKARKKEMYALLASISLPGHHFFVLQSHQLGPGIGGYRPEALFQLLEQIKPVEEPLFISTACRCHGVMTGFERTIDEAKIDF